MLTYWVWLAQLKLPLWRKHALLERFRDPEELYHTDWDKLQEEIDPKIRKVLEERDLSAARGIVEACQDKKIQILPFDGDAYPERLRNIHEAPLVLYCRGNLPDWDAGPAIGIVGTRKASSYGLQTAMRFGKQIAACGGIVVSGGAFGVDTVAMGGAIHEGKCTVGVLGCGVDVVYPKSNASFFETVVEKGCLISEYPPGTQAYSYNFPQRNRIISGLSNGIVVVEAPARSGALITAELAREQGRDVFSVPGNVGTEACEGSNDLLRQGAIPALAGWDVVREYESLYPQVENRQESTGFSVEEEQLLVAQNPKIPTKETKEKSPLAKNSIDNREKSSYSVPIRPSQLTAEEQAAAALLTDKVQSMDDVIARMDMPAGKALSLLTKLTLKGVAQSHPGKGISLK